MPLPPEIKRHYGWKWQRITRPRILKRAGGRFETRSDRANAREHYTGGAWCERCHWIEHRVDRASQLEIAHLVIAPGEPGHDADENLACLCHDCHKAQDRIEWARKCYETRCRRKDAERPLLEFGRWLA